MILIILSLLFMFLFVITDYGTFVLYGAYKVLSLGVTLYFNCFILLGVLILFVKLKVTSLVKG